MLMRPGLAVIALLMFFFQLLFAMTGKAQSITTEKVTLGLKDESLETAIKRIEQQSAFRFFYHSADVSKFSHLNLPQGTRTIEQTLNALLQNTPLSFRQMDNNILLECKEQKKTSEIKGMVLSSLDKKPIANASVFLSNATIGCNTAADGTFVLNSVKPGKYELVVSIVGFETYTEDLSADNSNKTLPDIELSPRTIILKEVNVKPVIDPDWDRNYQWFKDEFLGTSGLASECKIMNPEVLDLNYDRETGTLTASSEDFLRIENYALGYNIKYLLNNFIKINGIQSRLNVQFTGSAFFEEMRGTRAQEKRWLRRRLAAYDGSAMHFLRSGLNNTLDEEGFKTLRIVNKPNPKRPPDTTIVEKIVHYHSLAGKNRYYKDTLVYWKMMESLPKTLQTLEQTPLAQSDIMKLTNQKGLYALLSNNGSLYVTYNKRRHFDSSEKLNGLGGPSSRESTVVNFEIPYVLFDKNGCIINPDCVIFIGAWGENRVAELLPVDYDRNEIPDAFTDNIPPDKEVQSSFGEPISPKTELLKPKTIANSLAATRTP